MHIIPIMSSKSVSEKAAAFMFGLQLFFFFQAEDGIRDLYVTGVQTCALPISPRIPSTANRLPVDEAPVHVRSSAVTRAPWRARSEERRVGKECRSRWSPY